jgi:hypothetical protein
MSVQTSYAINMDRAYPGLLADLNKNRIISRLAEGGAIPFGTVVSRGTADDQCVLGGTDPIGVALRTLDREGDLGTADLEYKEKDAVAVIEDGAVYVSVGSTGSPGDVLKYVNATGAILTGAPGTGETALPGVLEETVAAVDDIARIRLIDVGGA